MPRFLFDYECSACKAVFEELVDRDNPGKVKCPQCSSTKTKRQVSAPRIDPRLGLQPGTFTTMADKWEKVRRQRQRIEAKRERDHGPIRCPT